jgi:hypothetical protein
MRLRQGSHVTGTVLATANRTGATFSSESGFQWNGGDVRLFLNLDCSSTSIVCLGWQFVGIWLSFDLPTPFAMLSTPYTLQLTCVVRHQRACGDQFALIAVALCCRRRCNGYLSEQVSLFMAPTGTFP